LSAEGRFTQIAKPRIGVYGFTGCAGDQLVIIHTEDQLLNLFNAVDVRSFVMASSNPTEEDLDVAFVEGSISTEKEIQHIKEIRARARIVVAIGNCAVSGGPQAMFAKDGSFAKRLKQVYGDVNFITNPVESTPVDEVVPVDYYLPGCPISQSQTMALIARLVHGADPEEFPHPVCHECKLNENRCLLLDKRFCLGPVTLGGCGSACPNNGLACVGCWGPNPDGNFAEQFRLLEGFGIPHEEVMRRVRNFGGYKILRYIEELGRVEG
jgi:sulfhydrogenase subunit delta